MKFILFLLYVVIEAFVEMIFLKRLSNDNDMSKEDKDRAFFNFAVLSAFWPISIPVALVAANAIGDDSCNELNHGGDSEDDLS